MENKDLLVLKLMGSNSIVIVRIFIYIVPISVGNTPQMIGNNDQDRIQSIFSDRVNLAFLRGVAIRDLKRN